MSATKFVPLSAKLVDEGEFLNDLDMELKEVQGAISAFRRQYGEKSKKAKAKLTVEIEVEIQNPDEDCYSVKTTMKTTLPKRPASVSLAMGGKDDDGKMALFVRAAGSDQTHPKQLKLATQGGHTIDTDSGKVVD